MSRRRAAQVRKISPDFRFRSVLLAKFINNVMERGKKTLACSIVYGALDTVQTKYGLEAKTTFEKAVENVRPFLEVKSVRVGGSNYQVPFSLEERRSTILALRWIIKAAKNRAENSMVLKLAEEFFEAANGRGGAVKMKDDAHKMAEANRAFAHFSRKKAPTS